jgi:hypothetical protein
VGDVVEVLGRAGEVHELRPGSEFDRCQLFLQEVLHRLDVVVGTTLDLLDPLHLRRTELGDPLPEGVGDTGLDRWKLAYPRLCRQGQEPFHFDGEPLAKKGCFREGPGEHLHLGRVAPVEGRKGAIGHESMVAARQPIARVRPARERSDREGTGPRPGPGQAWPGGPVR